MKPAREKSETEHTLWLRQPAGRWQDAWPCGNGTLGALLPGQIAHERIVLNHEALWFRRPPPSVPDVSAHLPALRARLAAGWGDWDAAYFLNQKLKENGYAFTGIDAFHPAFDIVLDMPPAGAFQRYRRALNLAVGEATTEWRIGRRAFARRLFVSRADDMVALALEADAPASLAGRMGLAPHALDAIHGMGSGQDTPAPRVPLTFEASAEPGWLTLRARYDDGREYGGVARLVCRGGGATVEREGMPDPMWPPGKKTAYPAVRVTAADAVLLLVKLYVCEASAVALPRLRRELEALPADYDALRERHAALHGALYRRTHIDLGGRGGGGRRSNEDWLAQAYEGRGAPTALLEQLCRYGRYLLLSSSRPGGWPANLQGVWNGDYQPAWSSDYHNDENIQMNYWQALPGALPEIMRPYFDYYTAHLSAYRENARAVYGCRGILAPVAQSTHGKIYPDPWVNWTAGAGWLAQLFYDYWLFTGDRVFLAERAVPFLKEVALFYEDFLVEDGQGRWLFAPSLSPENVPARAHASMVAVNATMDVAVAREVLAHLCAACRELGVEADGVQRWEALAARLPDYAVNADGALKEWIHPDLPDNYEHRHLSHLYPVFPGVELIEETHPALVSAARVALDLRRERGLHFQTGWSLVHMACAYARVGAGERAWECLDWLCRSCIGPNYFAYHNDWRAQGITMYWGPDSRPPFQIDANLGFPAAVQEMIVFSKPGWLKLLPALPKRWSRGRVDGLCCRGGIAVSIAWDLKAGIVRAEVRSACAQTVTLKCPRAIVSVRGAPAGVVSASPYGAAYRALRLPKDNPVRLHIIF